MSICNLASGGAAEDAHGWEEILNRHYTTNQQSDIKLSNPHPLSVYGRSLKPQPGILSSYVKNDVVQFITMVCSLSQCVAICYPENAFFSFSFSSWNYEIMVGLC